MKKYTELEVLNMLSILLIYSSANNNQGLSKIKGKNFGERARRILEVFKSIEDTSIPTILKTLGA